MNTYVSECDTSLCNFDGRVLQGKREQEKDMRIHHIDSCFFKFSGKGTTFELSKCHFTITLHCDCDLVATMFAIRALGQVSVRRYPLILSKHVFGGHQTAGFYSIFNMLCL